MEMDIRSGLQFFSAWVTDVSGQSRPQWVLSTMTGPTDRYVHPDAGIKTIRLAEQATSAS